MNKRTLSYALERVLVLFVVSSAATCFGLLFGDLISHFTSFNFIPWIFSIYIVLTSAVALCVSWIFLNEEASVFANFRFLVFYEIFSIILFSFIVPGVPLYMAMPPSIIGWFLTVKLDKAFTCHTSFMENCGDLSGQALASMLHEQNWLTSDFVEQIDDSLFKLGILSFIDFVFFLILWNFR